MDYGKSGNAKSSKNTPRHAEHNAYGTDKTPLGARPSKAELLAKMKAAAETKAEAASDTQKAKQP